MTNRIDAARLQPMLLGVAIVAALLAAVALLLSGRAMQQQAQLREHLSSLTAIAQNIPLQAGAAVRGSAPAFDALAASRTRLERVIDEIDAGKSAVGLLSSPSARVLGSERGWPALLEQSQAVLDGRDAALQAQKSAASVRESTPRLLSTAAGVLKAMGPSRPDAVNRNFERFELRAQAIDQDLTALADGTASVEAASRRLTDSLEFMAQVAAGANGQDNTLGITPAVGDAATEIEILVGRQVQPQFLQALLCLGQLVVVDEDGDEWTLAIKDFNEHVANDDSAVAGLLTVRDGMTLVQKRAPSVFSIQRPRQSRSPSSVTPIAT